MAGAREASAPHAPVGRRVPEMAPRGGQLAGQCARAAAEARVVLVGAVPGVHNQLAVGEEGVVRAVGMDIHTCGAISSNHHL